MLGAHSPVVLFRDSIDSLLGQLPAIREGTEEGFHQGRVAIRRVRETLPIVRGHYDDKMLVSIETRLRKAARVLGRARDADVAQQLIQHVESRFLSASSTTRVLSASVAAEQVAARRRAIKRLESLELPAVGDELRRTRHPFRWRPSATGWRTALRNHIVRRAGDVRSAIDHAGGVYFPNRAHSVRVAIKRLRYALELARATRTWRIPRANRTLKSAQGALGEAHDRELLIKRIGEMADASSSAAEAAALRQFLQAETHTFHAAYLRCRPGVLAVCQACEREARPKTAAKRSVLLASAAVPAMLMLRNTANRRGGDREGVVERRQLHAVLP